MNFSRVNFSRGLFCWKNQSQKLRPKNSGPKFGRPKFVSQNSALNSGSGGRILSQTSIRKEFPQRERIFRSFIRKSIRIRWRIPSQRLIRSFFFEIWWRKFASEFSGRVRIHIRIRNCIAATAVHSDPAHSNGKHECFWRLSLKAKQLLHGARGKP